MKYSQFIIVFLLSLLFLPAGIKANEPLIEFTMPNSTFVSGETINIQWKSTGFTQKRPVFIYLQDLETERFKIIGLARNQINGDLSGYEWQIPDSLEGSFRFRLSTRANGKWERKRSSNFYILPKKEIDSSQPDIKEEIDDSNVELNTKWITTAMPLVGQYQLSAQYEPWEVRRISIVNDSENDGFEVDAGESTSLIEAVFIRYKNEKSEFIEQRGVLSGNQAVFSNLGLYVPANGFADLEIYAQIVKASNLNSEQIGLGFRLGVQDRGNTESSFEAIGLISSDRDTTFSKVKPSDTKNTQEVIVRKLDPQFETQSSSNRPLINGQNTFYEFSLSADQNYPIGLARLVFDVYQNGVGSIDQIEFFRGNQKLTPGDMNSQGEVNLIWDAGSASCLAHTDQAGVGTGMNCNGSTQSHSKLIVSFTNEEIITNAINYKIRMRSQQLNGNASVQTRLSTGDENSDPNTGGPISTVGQIYNGTGVNQLFSNSADFINEASTITDRNFIWSDQSVSSQHRYPSFFPGSPSTIGTNSSADFTTGFLLNLDQLPEISLTQ